MRIAVISRIAVVGFFGCPLCSSQISTQRQTLPGPPQTTQTERNVSASSDSDTMQAQAEFQRGTALTRQGKFREAIPHLLAARENVGNEYALEFNLSLSYVGVGEYKKAIQILDRLRGEGRDNADVENLLAQAYLGDGNRKEALVTVERAAAIAPQNEKLYIFVADACTDHQDFELGLKVVEIGLRGLPLSARLHYERAMFLTQLDQFDHAKEDFELAGKLGQSSEIGYLAAAQQNLLSGNIPEAVRISREGIRQDMRNPALLVILGKALLRSGIAPGQPEFGEAQDALERAVAQHPNDAGSQIALGQIYLAVGRLDDAIAHLQIALRMQPNQPSIYASLGKAYQRKGDTLRAQESFAQLERLNQAQAEQIRSAPGERKMSYGGNSSPQPQ